ncbi:MAG TPA: M23 family metallopeptidase [Bryobacteraceae bacterium]|nr:M23 family metallopeptidase [Bryobacteraceae bacterium]
MNQQCFVLEFAHSVDGRIRRIHISYRAIGYLVLTFLVLSACTFGMASSYWHMSRQVSHYNQLRTDFDHLRARYQKLQQVSGLHTQQIASLEALANEVSAAYGISGPPSPPSSEILQADAPAGVKESIKEYNFLKAATYSGIFHRYAYAWQDHAMPSLWPVDGALSSGFGGRTDPFSGEGTFHTGVDLEAAVGTPVHVTADGVVTSAAWSGAYGKRVVVDHGNGIETYYAHLSEFRVIPGEEVHRGQVIALSGGTGRATGPHIHYEVRLRGTPVNPYKYLAKSPSAASTRAEHSDLGL